MKIALSCIASIDYFKKYAKCIESQKKFCKKYNYDYCLNSDDDDILHWKDWYWKKIKEAKKILLNYDYVVIIDCDCEITDIAESIESVLDDNSIYYTLGISHRPNSGFLIIKNNKRGLSFLNDILEKRDNKFPDNYSSTKGENGHVIWSLVENNQGTKELDLKWNCSQPEFLESAYIIHYTNKMRSFFKELL
jgi:hypothetical protein